MLGFVFTTKDFGMRALMSSELVTSNGSIEEKDSWLLSSDVIRESWVLSPNTN